METKCFCTSQDLSSLLLQGSVFASFPGPFGSPSSPCRHSHRYIKIKLYNNNIKITK